MSKVSELQGRLGQAAAAGTAGDGRDGETDGDDDEDEEEEEEEDDDDDERAGSGGSGKPVCHVQKTYDPVPCDGVQIECVGMACRMNHCEHSATHTLALPSFFFISSMRDVMSAVCLLSADTTKS